MAHLSSQTIRFTLAPLRANQRLSPRIATFGGFRELGVPYFGVLIIRILLFRVLYYGPLFLETPIFRAVVWKIRPEVRAAGSVSDGWILRATNSLQTCQETEQKPLHRNPSTPKPLYP